MYKFAVMTLHYSGRGEYCNKTKSGGFIGRLPLLTDLESRQAY